MNPADLGAVVSVRGSVVDIRFDAHLPPIYSLLHAKEGKIAIEVLVQLDAHSVRGIALTPTEGLARGSAVGRHGRSGSADLSAQTRRGVAHGFFAGSGLGWKRASALLAMSIITFFVAQFCGGVQSPAHLRRDIRRGFA